LIGVSLGYRQLGQGPATAQIKGQTEDEEGGNGITYTSLRNRCRIKKGEEGIDLKQCP
jgi:hypothetical protein